MGREARVSKKRQIGDDQSMYGTAAEVRQAASDARRLEKIGLVLGTRTILDPKDHPLVKP